MLFLKEDLIFIIEIKNIRILQLSNYFFLSINSCSLILFILLISVLDADLEGSLIKEFYVF